MINELKFLDFETDIFFFFVILCVIANFMQCFSPDTFVAAYVVKIKLFPSAVIDVSILVGLVRNKCFCFYESHIFGAYLLGYKIKVIFNLCRLVLFDINI